MPVTQPKVQNLAQRAGIKLAGWRGSGERIRWSLLEEVSVVEVAEGTEVVSEGLPEGGQVGHIFAVGAAPVSGLDSGLGIGF